MISPVVSLAGREWHLSAPRSIPLALGLLARPAQERASAPHLAHGDLVAVLALCWPEGQHLPWGPWPAPVPGRSPTVYGEACWAYLWPAIADRRTSVEEVEAAALVAWQYVAGVLLPASATLEEARGNSGAPAGASSGE